VAAGAARLGRRWRPGSGLAAGTEGCGRCAGCEDWMHARSPPAEEASSLLMLLREGAGG
jgi:hypothetical protein